ncbi:MAG: FdtA/QdtA family cupin domain-containing protein [Bacteroidales bacterium]|nr:WxcM-like domain-containing protein [Muribaculaceae bacterium]MBQ5409026.1 WxcM-like domain-containing protein [Muribaculaceae bacterium]MDY6412920.1 FdtA/QdtA family cupin domain-containing protein [Bacteroidales bacterium]
MNNFDGHRTSRVEDCELIELGKNHHANGNLTVVENGMQVPFDIKRVYYLYDVPGGEERGGHSHKALKQFIVAISGAFDVVIDDGINQRTITLNRPYQGLLIVPGIWRVINNFSSGAVCLVLASEHYDEADYVRDYQEFKQLTSTKTTK